MGKPCGTGPCSMIPRLGAEPTPGNQVRGRTYTWQLGNLGPGDRTVVTYQAVVGTNAAAGRNENIAEARGIDGGGNRVRGEAAGRNENIAEARGTDGGGNRVRGEDRALVMLGSGDLEWLGKISVKALIITRRWTARISPCPVYGSF